MQGILFILFGVVLCHAAVVDYKYRLIRRYVWWIAGGIAFCFLMLKTGDIPVPQAPFSGALISFVLLQFLFFSKLYGRADCYAFSCCSVMLKAFGGGMREYLLHMLLAVGILGVVELLRKNVDRLGNLKEPVAFIPYITAAFYALLFIKGAEGL